VLVKQRFYTKSSFWRRLIVLIFIILIVIAFWDLSVGIFWQILWALLGIGQMPPPNKISGAIEILFKFVMLLTAFAAFSLFMISQFVLPVSTMAERRKVFFRMIRYWLGRHGPAVFIREGKEVANPEELKREFPGVAFVDMSSAIVLEKTRQPEDVSKLFSTKLMNGIRWMFGAPPKVEVPILARAAGPGIVFIEEHEKIQGAADLRRQVRINGLEKDERGNPLLVTAFTNDGIRVRARVTTIFTLGQPPDVVKVAYVDEPNPDGSPPDPKLRYQKLRVLEIGKKSDPVKDQAGQIIGWKNIEYIKRISQNEDDLDLDEVDKQEIHNCIEDRQRILALVNVLSEQTAYDFVAAVQPNYNLPVRAFIASLWEDDKAVLRRFVNKLVPVDTDTISRFVINEATCHQLVDQIRPVNDKQVHDFVRVMFRHPDRARDFYRGLPAAQQQPLGAFFRDFYTSQTIKSPASNGSSGNWTPFRFDQRRVFAALYGKARNVKVSKVDEWTELPPQVATDIFRKFISKVKLDEIYNADEPSDKPFPFATKWKPRFMKLVKYQGVLSYQVIQRNDGRPPEVGDVVNKETYFTGFPVIELRTPKPLRDRGIKVIVGSFSELNLDDDVKQQRMEMCLTRLRGGPNKILAQQKIDEQLLAQRVRAEAMGEMTTTLGQIFQMPYSQEAMAIRLFQALETAISDPGTNKLVPHDTIELLRSLRYWLLPENATGDLSPGETPTSPDSDPFDIDNLPDADEAPAAD
jgi:hypothetical protein